MTVSEFKCGRRWPPSTGIRMNFRHVSFGLLAAVSIAATPVLAADDLSLTIKDHKFEPATIEVPAGERVKLTIVNADKTAEEFESHDLHVEKMIPGGQTISVYVGPLEPGTYGFFGEMHEDTAKGELIAK